MIKNLASVAFLIIIGFTAAAQTEGTPATGKKTGRPDIPGSFILDLGLNRFTDRPNLVKTGLWGSRTLNAYYFQDMRIGKSKFTFHPGIGLGMERFKFMNYKVFNSNDTITLSAPTLGYDNVGNTVFLRAVNYVYDADTLKQVDYSSSYQTHKSMLAMTYVDVPFEIRYNIHPEDPNRSFKIAVGGRIGYLLNAHTKIKYKENGDLKKLKNTQSFNLSPFRYSVYMKVYLGNFAVFGYYDLNPTFKPDKGPSQTTTRMYTIGISLSSF